MDDKAIAECQGAILSGIDAISDAPSDIECREAARSELEEFVREYRELKSRQMCASHNARLYSNRTQELVAEVDDLKRQLDDLRFLYKNLSEHRMDDGGF